MKRGAHLRFAVLLAVVGASRPGARAQDAAPTEASADGDVDLGDLESLLDERVVTTASRSAERASTAPATVVTIDADTMRRYGMRSLDEALAYLGLGSFVSESGGDYTSGQDVGVQGVLLRDRGRHVLLLVDGHVANAQSTGETRLDVALGVPFEIIDHVELMLGPGSVSYGSNAMMAVVNVVTRRARDYGSGRFVAEGTLGAPTGIGSGLASPGGGDRFGGRYRLGAGFARAGRVAGRDAEIVVHGEWQQEVSSTYRMAYQTGDFFDVRPGEPGWGGVARHRMRAPSVHVSARLGNARLWLQGSSYDRTTPLIGTFVDPLAREARTSLRGELRHDAVLSPELSLASRLYGDHVRLDERSNWIRSFYCLPGQQVDGCAFQRRNGSSWVGIEEQLTADWKLDGRFVTTVGGDLRFRYGVARPADYTDRLSGAPPWTVRLPYWQSNSVLGALFVQQVVRISDAFLFNAGVRFDADSLFGVHLSPRAAVSFVPTERTSVRVGFSEAFRAPSAQELYDTDPTYVIRPARLAAEVVRTVDVELSQRFAHGSVSGRAFGSFYDGMLAQRAVTMPEFDAALAAGLLVSNADPAYVAVWDNSDKIVAVGGTLAAQAEPVRGLELATNLTLSTNHLRGAGSLPIIPSFYGNARVSYRIGERGPTFALASVFGSRQIATNESASGFFSRLSTGALGNLRFTASGAVGSVTGLSWRASVQGALNARSPYVFSPGPTATDPNNTLALGPVPRLFVFVGVNYDLP